MAKTKRTTKRSKRRERNRKRILRLFLFVLTILAIYLLLFKTDLFNIKSIEVVGNQKLNEDQIIKASLCRRGENIFNISKKKGVESLMQLPYIKEANIERKLPDKLIIEVVERREIAIIPYIGSYIYIDEEGYILKIEGQNEEVDLLRIDGIKLENPNPGDNLFHLFENDSIMEFFTFGNSSNLLTLMKRVDFADKDNIIIDLIDGIKVAFGTLDDVKYKLSFLNKIIEDIREKDIKAKQILFDRGDNPIVVTDDR